MNIYDLKSLSVYKAEARRSEERIEELNTILERSTANQDGMPKGKGGSNYFVETVLDSKSNWEHRYEEAILHVMEVENEVYAIEDLLVRNITLRKFVDGCSWNQTAMKIGGGNTKDSVRKVFYRYAKKRGWM